MNFEMTGKLSISKDTEKFHPYSETKYEKSGWVRRRLLFNVTCGDSRHMLTVQEVSKMDTVMSIHIPNQNTTQVVRKSKMEKKFRFLLKTD